MHPILKDQFKRGITKLTQDNFQKFCEQLFIKKYGQNFEVIKNKKDGGGDGILNQDTIIAVYSPEKENKNTFKSKVKEDYDKYNKNWKERYGNWCFVYNGELTKDRIEIMDSLCNGSKRLDINQLLEMVEELIYPRMKELAEHIGIDVQLIYYDILKNVIDDLTKEKNLNIKLSNEIPAYIVKKVQKNYLPEEVNDAVNEYGELLPEITRLQKVLKEYDDSENLALKTKVKEVYDMLNGNFKEKVRNLVALLSESHKKDDLYIFYTRVAVVYFFERCVVGENPDKGENKK